MLKGINLTLMIGPAVPVPAPKSVMEAVESIQVSSQGTKTAFQLTFNVSQKSPLLRVMLPAGYFDPIVTRVIIIVTLRGLPTVLMDGLITRQELTTSNEPGQAKLTITGEDLSVAMDVVEIKRPYPGMPDDAQIRLVLAPYAALGMVPVVIPPIIIATRTPIDGWGTQTGTDLEYVRQIASRSGYVFFVEPGPVPGQSVAYFGPDIRLPNPQAALSVNMDAHTNVESLSFSLDGLSKKIVIVNILDPVTRENILPPIPLPNISVVRPPLGLRPTIPSKVEYSDNLATVDPAEAIKRVFGVLLRASDSISCNGSLDVLRYGGILRSRQIVGVRGASITYDGYYYVNSVTHSIKPGEYKQNFSLSRDGLISQTPRVLV